MEKGAEKDTEKTTHKSTGKTMEKAMEKRKDIATKKVAGKTMGKTTEKAIGRLQRQLAADCGILLGEDTHGGGDTHRDGDSRGKGDTHGDGDSRGERDIHGSGDSHGERDIHGKMGIHGMPDISGKTGTPGIHLIRGDNIPGQGWMSDEAYGLMVRDALLCELRRQSRERGGNSLTIPVPRVYDGIDPFFHAIITPQGAYLRAEEPLYAWCGKEVAGEAPEWLFRYDFLRRLDTRLSRYGRRIADVRICYIPGEEYGGPSGGEEAPPAPGRNASNRDGRGGSDEGGQEPVGGSDEGEQGSDKGKEEPVGGSGERGRGRMEQLPQGVALRLYDSEALERLRSREYFPHALAHSALCPNVLALAAVREAAAGGKTARGEEILGIAGATADCPTMWQIGVDVKPQWRGRGLGAYLVRTLARVIMGDASTLKRQTAVPEGVFPFYSTAQSHIVSMRTALRAGFIPYWTELYVERIEK